MSLRMTLPGHAFDKVAGVDEAGRGPLAGDVVAAAVILDPGNPIRGINDSKKLTPGRREQVYGQVIEHALCYAVARVSAVEIDAMNILQASLLAMHRAVKALGVEPGFVYVDGNRCPAWSYPSRAVVKGDSLIASVAAASVLAKVERDRDMMILDEQFPEYGFARHKGYPTVLHLEALSRLGPCAAHRRSYRPVADCIRKME